MVKEVNEIASLRNYFVHHKGAIKLEELRAYFRTINPDIANSTINWRTYELVKSSILKRTGRGLFEIGEEISFVPQGSKQVNKISSYIKELFPLAAYCVWDSAILNEFAQHLSGYPFLLIDVEREVAESVYFRLKEKFKPVFFRLNNKLRNDLLTDFEYPLLVRYLTSESPLNYIKDLPIISIEKLLVDVFCDAEFNYLEGSELRAIYNNAFYKYTINKNKLFRYAARKGKKEEISKFIETIKANTIIDKDDF